MKHVMICTVTFKLESACITLHFEQSLAVNREPSYITCSEHFIFPSIWFCLQLYQTVRGITVKMFKTNCRQMQNDGKFNFYFILVGCETQLLALLQNVFDKWLVTKLARSQLFYNINFMLRMEQPLMIIIFSNQHENQIFAVSYFKVQYLYIQ